MKQNKENETHSLRRESLKTQETEKHLEKANDTIKRLETELKSLRRDIHSQQKNTKLNEEDRAALLTRMEQENGTLLRTYTEQIGELKSKIEGDNRIWMERFDIRRKEYDAQTQKAREDADRQIKDTQDKYEEITRAVREQLEKDCRERLEGSQKEIQALKTLNHEKIQELMSGFQQEKEKIRREYQNKIQAIHINQLDEVNRLKKSHELTLASIKGVVRAEENMHKDTKAKIEVEKRIFLKEIEDLKESNSKALEEILTLKVHNSELESKLLQQISDNKRTNEEWMRKLEEEQETYESQMQDLNLKHTQDSKSLLANHFCYVERLEHTFKVLEEKHLEQKELHATQIEQIKLCYEERPSREEDIQSMSTIEEMLSRKSRELEVVRNQLKWCRLELDNKEDTYKRIFAVGERPLIVPVHHRERKIKRLGQSINHREMRSDKAIAAKLF